MKTKKCYICKSNNPDEWYSLWYDGEQREICSLACRSDIQDMCELNPEKTYSKYCHKCADKLWIIYDFHGTCPACGRTKNSPRYIFYDNLSESYNWRSGFNSAGIFFLCDPGSYFSDVYIQKKHFKAADKVLIVERSKA